MQNQKKIKLAVLIGRGGRLPAIYGCVKDNPLIDLVCVISHKKESPGIDLAKNWGVSPHTKQEHSSPFGAKSTGSCCGVGVESFYFRLSDWKNQGKSREEYNLELARILKEREINFVIMAGWDLILSNDFLKQFPEQVINVHPSLCPAFPGLDADKQALDYGVRYTGATVHFVLDDGVDTGPIILQAIVKIEPDETPETLQEKIHQEEEKILCQAINLFSQSRLKIEGRKVILL